MSDNLSFKEACNWYLNEPTKMGRDKNPNAHSVLEWMYEKRPSMILVEGRKKPIKYGAKTRELPHKVVLWDETSGMLASKSMGDIGNRDVTKIISVLRNDKGLSNAGINTYLVYLRAVCNFARNNLDVAFTKFPQIKTLTTKEREYYIQPAVAKEWMRFLDPLRADLVRFGLATGQRKSNVMYAKWSWISKDLTRMVIPADVTKTGVGHTVMLNKQAIAVLKKRREDRKALAEKYPRLSLEYVFFQTNKQHLGKPMSATSMTKEKWKRSISLYNESVRLRAERNGTELDRDLLIPEGGTLLFHTLRHSFATWLNKAGTDLDDIMLVGGWKSMEACRRYVKKDEARAKAVGARIENLF